MTFEEGPERARMKSQEERVQETRVPVTVSNAMT